MNTNVLLLFASETLEVIIRNFTLFFGPFILEFIDDFDLAKGSIFLGCLENEKEICLLKMHNLEKLKD